LVIDWLSTDGKLVLSARVIRTFAYGFLSIILAIYLKLIGFNDILIGILLTATLVNSVIFTLIASFYADRIGSLQSLPALLAPFVVGGALKISYDIALYLNFRKIKPAVEENKID
jgi:MFS family permease